LAPVVDGVERYPASLAYSPDGRFLAVGDAFNGITLWNLTGRTVAATLTQHRPPSILTFAPDGRTPASVAGTSVLLWDLSTSARRAELRGHKGKIWSFAFTANGQTLVSGGQDGTVRLWDVASGGQRHAFDWQGGKVYTVAVAPDGLRAAAGGQTDILIWDVDAN
jgi:WD40 repeat protein